MISRLGLLNRPIDAHYHDRPKAKPFKKSWSPLFAEPNNAPFILLVWPLCAMLMVAGVAIFGGG
jgi:hypothetical protein